jgi:hypothetical protein
LRYFSRLQSGGWDAAWEWLRWSDLRQTLLAGFGVFGLAAAIMALISSDALLMETRATTQIEPPSVEAPELRSAELPLEVPQDLRPEFPAELPSETASWKPDEEAIALAFAFFPLEPAASPAPFDLRLVRMPASAPAAPETTAALPTAVPESGLPTETGHEPASAESMGTTPCPRDWLMPADPEAPAAVAECEAVAVLTPPAPSADDIAALEEAASEQARLAGLIPPLPRPRPEPTPDMLPVRRVAHRGASDWPAEPPPNCGRQHAYWRFVDRKAGTKEWYCR